MPSPMFWGSNMDLDTETARIVSASLLRMHDRSAFFTALALFARFESSQQIPTAATDGRTIFVNPAFIGGLTTAEQDALLLHEVLHAALLHVPRRGGRDPKLWNVAADIVVNGMLIKQGYTLPAGGLRDTSLEHLSVEEAYQLLLRRQKPQPQPPDDLLEGPPEDAGTGQDDDGAAVDREAIERHWHAAQQQAKSIAEGSLHGDVPAGMQRELGGIEAARLDWRSYLWRYLTQTQTDFQHFDRRFVGRGVYLETLSGETVNVLVGVDTSGSIDAGALEAFVNEVRGVLRAYPHLRCELYYADTALYGPHRLTPRSELPPPQGGGGTDFRPFFERAERRGDRWTPSVAIYLTDGYGSFPSAPPRLPVLWVVTPGGLALDKFPFGQAVRLLPH
jgi:predicted metal-dependent peptidase